MKAPSWRGKRVGALSADARSRHSTSAVGRRSRAACHPTKRVRRLQSCEVVGRARCDCLNRIARYPRDLTDPRRSSSLKSPPLLRTLPAGIVNRSHNTMPRRDAPGHCVKTRCLLQPPRNTVTQGLGDRDPAVSSAVRGVDGPGEGLRRGVADDRRQIPTVQTLVVGRRVAQRHE